MMTNSHSSRRKTIHGYTLVEVMIALTMFAFITLATGFALGVAIRSSRNTQSHNDSNAEVRSVMSVLTADLRNVYASSSNPYSVFTTSGSDAATLLTFSAFAGRIAAPPGAYSGSSATDGSDWYPQSDIGTISYSFDSNSRSLIRQISGYPNTDLNANSSTAGRESILSTKILNIQFQFYDITNQQYRSDWNYSNQITLNINTSASSGSGGQSNNSTGTSGTTGGTSAGTGATGTSSASSTASQTTTDPTTGTATTNGVTTDMYLPKSVTITVTFLNAAGQPEQHTTSVSMPNYQPQPTGQKPDAAITATTTTGGGTGTRPGTGSGTGTTTGKGIQIYREPNIYDILPGLRK